MFLHNPTNLGAIERRAIAFSSNLRFRQNMSKLSELRALVARHAHDGVHSSTLDDLIFMSSRVPTEIQSTRALGSVVEPALALVVQGKKRVVLADKVIDYGPGQYLVVSFELPLSAQILRASANEPFLAFSLTLKPAAIASLLLETGSNDRGATDVSGIALSTATENLLDPLIRLLSLLDTQADVPVLRPGIEKEILWRLINGEQAQMIRQIGLADSRLTRIGRATRWIRDHYADSLQVEELAQMIGMSVTSFHRHFRAVTMMSPVQYQKQIRLQEARARLIAEGDDVAAVGFNVGYDSPSQFSREYSRLFGAPPGRDASRLKALAARRESFSH
jgi:AraC-like DNA-binding protein